VTSPASDDEHPVVGDDDPADIDDELGFDASLVPFAPTSLLSVAANSLLPIGLGVAAIVFTPVVVRVDVAILRVAIPILASLGIALGIVVGIVGVRAFATFAGPDISRYMRVQVIGFWMLSASVLLAGIVGASGLFALFGFGALLSLWFVYGSRPGRSGDAVTALYRRLWPAFIVECIVVIVATPIAALVSTQFEPPDDIAARYVADALILPIAAAVVLVLLLRSRRRHGRAGGV
jgi:hypothetical protein